MTQTPEPSSDSPQSASASAGSDRFMSVAVHDIRNPVAVMRASAQMAMRQMDRGDLTAARARIGVIVDQTDRVTRLMEFLLDAAHIASESLPLRTETVGIHSLIEDAVAIIRSNGGQHAARELESQLDPEWMGTWDRARMGRAVLALLENAYIYGPLDQPVAVAGKTENGSLIVTFSGGGPGPTEEEQARLFELFYRGSSAGEAGQPGSGLGLYTARGIARAHGGDVEFSPNGKPDIFKLKLPLTPAS